jgi:hypothetical protein
MVFSSGLLKVILTVGERHGIRKSNNIHLSLHKNRWLVVGDRFGRLQDPATSNRREVGRMRSGMTIETIASKNEARDLIDLRNANAEL